MIAGEFYLVLAIEAKDDTPLEQIRAILSSRSGWRATSPNVFLNPAEVFPGFHLVGIDPQCPAEMRHDLLQLTHPQQNDTPITVRHGQVRLESQGLLVMSNSLFETLHGL